MRNVLLLVAIAYVTSYPLKEGLNNKHTWRAWFLPDKTNELKEPKRPNPRIVEKAIFITPTFSPCADGYKSDFMGRCVKVIKIDESVHYNFLLKKLNAKFSDFKETVRGSTEGPFQLKIPIFGDFNDNTLEEETVVVQEEEPNVENLVKMTSVMQYEEVTTLQTTSTDGDDEGATGSTPSSIQ